MHKLLITQLRKIMMLTSEGGGVGVGSDGTAGTEGTGNGLWAELGS